MAAKYRKVDSWIWVDEKFSKLEQMDKLIALYVLTGQSNRVGLFMFNMIDFSREVGIIMPQCGPALQFVCDEMGWMYDDSGRVVFIPNWWKENPRERCELLGDESVFLDLHWLPYTPLFPQWWDTVRDFISSKGWNDIIEDCVEYLHENSLC